MEILKIVTNGRKQGVYAITKKEEVTDALLDMLNDNKENKEFTKDMLYNRLKNGLCIIPKDSKPFEWNDDLHGKFFTDSE